jgi:hypothetical protein
MTDSYFGLCPKCHDTDGYFNVGQGHWFFCTPCRTKWFVGSNLFDSWKHETVDEQRAAYEKAGYGDYAEVRPAIDYEASIRVGDPFWDASAR